MVKCLKRKKDISCICKELSVIIVNRIFKQEALILKNVSVFMEFEGLVPCSYEVRLVHKSIRMSFVHTIISSKSVGPNSAVTQSALWFHN